MKYSELVKVMNKKEKKKASDSTQILVARPLI
jgi:hypothetical protein